MYDMYEEIERLTWVAVFLHPSLSGIASTQCDAVRSIDVACVRVSVDVVCVRAFG